MRAGTALYVGMQARVFARTEDLPGACSQSQWRPTSSAGCSGDVQGQCFARINT